MIDETSTNMPEPGDASPVEPGAAGPEDLVAGPLDDPGGEAPQDGGLTYTSGGADQDVTAPLPYDSADLETPAPAADPAPEPFVPEETQAEAPLGAERAYEPAATAEAYSPPEEAPLQPDEGQSADVAAQPEQQGESVEPSPYAATQDASGYTGAEAAGAAGAYAAAYGNESTDAPVPEPGPEEVSGEAAAAGGVSGGTRRALIIGGLAAGLLVVLGLAVLAALFAFGMFAGQQQATPPATSAGGSATTGTAQGGTAASASPTEPAGLDTTVTVAVVTNADVYESRDPFEPLLDVPETSTTTSGTTSESTTSTSETSSETANASESEEPSGTLTLVAVVTEDGVRKAKLTLDGTTYLLAAGEQVDDTPWQVLEVGSDSVVMLFGDERITLTVGQGVSK